VRARARGKTARGRLLILLLLHQRLKARDKLITLSVARSAQLRLECLTRMKSTTSLMSSLATPEFFFFPEKMQLLNSGGDVLGIAAVEVCQSIYTVVVCDPI